MKEGSEKITRDKEEVGAAATESTRATAERKRMHCSKYKSRCQGKRQSNSRQGLGELINIARRRVEGER